MDIFSEFDTILRQSSIISSKRNTSKKYSCSFLDNGDFRITTICNTIIAGDIVKATKDDHDFSPGDEIDSSEFYDKITPEAQHSIKERVYAGNKEWTIFITKFDKASQYGDKLERQDLNDGTESLVFYFGGCGSYKKEDTDVIKNIKNAKNSGRKLGVFMIKPEAGKKDPFSKKNNMIYLGQVEYDPDRTGSMFIGENGLVNIPLIPRNPESFKRFYDYVKDDYDTGRSMYRQGRLRDKWEKSLRDNYWREDPGGNWSNITYGKITKEQLDEAIAKGQTYSKYIAEKFPDKKKARKMKESREVAYYDSWGNKVRAY